MFIFETLNQTIETLNQTKKIYLSLEQIYIDKGKPGGMYVKFIFQLTSFSN